MGAFALLCVLNTDTENASPCRSFPGYLTRPQFFLWRVLSTVHLSSLLWSGFADPPSLLLALTKQRLSLLYSSVSSSPSSGLHLSAFLALPPAMELGRRKLLLAVNAFILLPAAVRHCPLWTLNYWCLFSQNQQVLLLLQRTTSKQPSTLSSWPVDKWV